jgi:hypothetical protein
MLGADKEKKPIRTMYRAAPLLPCSMTPAQILIPHKTAKNQRRPSAFVGWNVTIGGDGWGSGQSYYNYRTEWMNKWYYYWQSKTLWQALMEASQSANWPPGGQGQLQGALRAMVLQIFL